MVVGMSDSFTLEDNKLQDTRTPTALSSANLTSGESGLGKSTLINTLFETPLYQPKSVPAPGQDRGKTVQIESISSGKLPLISRVRLIAVTG